MLHNVLQCQRIIDTIFPYEYAACNVIKMSR